MCLTAGTKLNRAAELALITQQMLQYNRSLTSLTLAANQITMEGAKALGKLLSQGSVLVHLDVSSNRLCDEGAIVLADALQYNSGLETCVLSRSR